MKRLTLYSAACLGLVVLASGCSSTCNSWSVRDAWANRPTPIRNFFMRGKPCSSCNPATGRLDAYSANFVPGCENGECGNEMTGGTQPVYAGESAPAAYYPADIPDAGMVSPGVSNNTIRTNYPPAFSADVFGSGLQMDDSAMRTNTELETPPMYGSQGFN